MKKRGNALLIKRFGLCLFCVFSCFFLSVGDSFGKTAGINFGSQNSALKISSGAKLNVTSTSLTLTSGTLVKDSAAQITGNRIGFQESVFDCAGVEGTMTGVYSSNNSVNLVGSSLFRAQPGLILQNINVSGRLNRLEGQPLLSAPIILQDSNTTLTLAVQSVLNQNVQLNSGFIGLEDDLHFSDKKSFVGAGTVNLNGRSIYFNSGLDSKFTHTINWQNASDINLTSRTILSGTWSFGAGDNVLNGHGNILDLSSGGTLYIRSGATAEFTDVVIKGLGINKGWINFQDVFGKIYMSNVILEFDNRFTISNGSFYVEGPSTFILKNNNLTFDRRSTLSVDGVTLWKDETIYASTPSAGDIVFGSLQKNRALIDAGIILDAPDSNLVVYNSNAILKLEADDALKLIAIKNNSNAILKNTQNIRYNSNAILNVSVPNLSQLEGAIRANSRNIVYNSNAILSISFDATLPRYNSNAILTLEREIGEPNPLTQGPITTNITLCESYFIDPCEQIEIAGNITIDGQGAVLIFADPDHPQFVVRPGYTVTLKNIQFERISENTFDLRWRLTKSGIPAKWYLYDSQINIEEEVEFGLSENITFSQGLLNIIRNVSNDPEVFTMCGIDGRKKFDLDPTDAYQNAVIKASGDGTLPNRLNPNSSPVLLRLNDSAMLMQGIDLWGIEHISKTITDIVGSLVLAGDSSVNVGDTKFQLTSQQQNAGQKETYDLVFVVQDIDNQFRLLKDDLLFTGQLLYSDEGEGVLHISSTFAKDIVSPIDDSQRRIPLVNFGTGFVNLTSLNGKAILIFDDQQIIINNSPNGFIAEENSFLGGHEIQVAGDYIWDLYDPATGKSPFTFAVDRLIAPTLGDIPLISSLPSASPQLRSALENFRFVPRYKTAIDFKNQKKKEQDSNQAEKLELRAPVDLQNIQTVEKIKKLLLKLDPEYRTIVENALEEGLRKIQPPAVGSKVLDYINTSADMTDAKGNINLQNSTGTNFSILSSDPLNLTLRDASVLLCRTDDDVTLKSDDVLNVVGQDNEIHVSTTFYMNGQLLFDENSALTIIFDNSNAQVIFAENSEIDQEAGVKFVVKGKGKIIFGNNCKVTLNGSGASFGLQEWASLELMSNSRLDFKGVGKISVDQGAQINVAETGTIRIGISTVDKLSVSVASTGMINLSGKLLFAYGYTSLDVTQNGILMIQDNGVLGINIDLFGNPIMGHFDGFVLSPAGSFYLRPGGKLSIAANLKEYLPENKMVWKGDTTYFAGADITGKTGMVEYVSVYPARNVSGQIELFNGNFDTGETGLTAENLVRDLINRSYVLTQAIQFLDSVSKRWLRLSNGTIIEMVVGDEIQKEYENGVVEAKSLDGQIVLYKLNGTRVVMESYAVC